MQVAKSIIMKVSKKINRGELSLPYGRGLASNGKIKLVLFS